MSGVRTDGPPQADQILGFRADDMATKDFFDMEQIMNTAQRAGP